MIMGIDVGGTAAKMAFIDHAGVIHERFEVNTCPDHYQTPILDSVLAGINAFLSKAKEAPEGIAVSATGQIDMEQGVVIGTNGAIPGYEGTRFVDVINERYGVPCIAINDANAAALGECFAGKARGYKNVVMVTLGTGVGGGIVLDSKIFGGTRGIAGEIGHFTLYQDGPKCACGKRGCLEMFASTSALTRKAREMTGEKELNGIDVFARAALRDAAMLSLLDRWTDDISAGISGLVHIFNPEMILIGGGVSAQEKLLIEPLRKKILDQTMPRFAENLRIEAASLGNDAGMIGAAAYWLQKYHGS